MIDDAIFKYYTTYYRDTLGLPNWESLANSRIHEEKTEEARVDSFEKKVGPIKGKVVLNIGCGTGGFNVVTAQRGAEIHGIDPEVEAIRICHMKADKYDIPKERFLVGSAEHLPFKNDTYDLINCFTVLEHVDDVKMTLLEMVRVLKPGGKIYINSPHYWRLYEGHYKIFWCPLFLIRPIGKLYLRFRGRPSMFYDTLNFLNGSTIPNALRKESVKIHTHHPSLKRTPGIVGLIIFLYQTTFRIDSNIISVITKNPSL